MRYRPIRLRAGEQPTADPHVAIEEQREGYVRYRHENGRRWEVHGTCDRRGDCLIGTYVEAFGWINSRADLELARRKTARERLDAEMDVPVTPEFNTCCGRDRFTYVELEPWK